MRTSLMNVLIKTRHCLRILFRMVADEIWHSNWNLLAMPEISSALNNPHPSSLETLWRRFGPHVTSHPDFMDEKNEGQTGEMSSSQITQLLMVEHGLEPKGISTVVLWDTVGRWQFKSLLPPQLSFMLPLSRWPHMRSPVTTMHLYPACFPNDWLETFHKPAVKQTSGWIIFSLSHPSPILLFKRHHHIHICNFSLLWFKNHTLQRWCFLGFASRPAGNHCSCASVHHPAPRPPPHAHTTTSVVMGVLIVDTISAATTSYDSQLHP